MNEKSDLIRPPAFEPIHHSLADWDWPAAMTYALDTVIKVVEPASVKLTWNAGPQFRAILCRRANCQDLPEGQIYSWNRCVNHFQAIPMWCFCNQSPLGSASLDNCYFVCFSSNKTFITKRVAGVNTTVCIRANLHPLLTWYRERVTWWSIPGARLFCMEKWVGEAWVQLGDIATDGDPLWEESGVNRLGLAVNMPVPGNLTWHDETYLCGPV